MAKRKSRRKGGVLNFFRGIDNQFKRRAAWAKRGKRRRVNGGLLVPIAMMGAKYLFGKMMKRFGRGRPGTKSHGLTRGRDVWAAG